MSAPHPAGRSEKDAVVSTSIGELGAKSNYSLAEKSSLSDETLASVLMLGKDLSSADEDKSLSINQLIQESMLAISNRRRPSTGVAKVWDTGISTRIAFRESW